MCAVPLAGVVALVGVPMPLLSQQKEQGEQEEVSTNEDLMSEHGVLKRVLLAYDETIRRIRANQEFSPQAVRDGATTQRLSSQHRKARSWVERTFSNGMAVGLSWQTVAAFLRIMTNPRLPGERFTLEEAVHILQEWLEQPNIRILAPGDDHWPLFRQMTVDGQAHGPLISDAQLAALAIAQGGVSTPQIATSPGSRACAGSIPLPSLA